MYSQPHKISKLTLDDANMGDFSGFNQQLERVSELCEVCECFSDSLAVMDMLTIASERGITLIKQEWRFRAFNCVTSVGLV